MSPLPPIPPNPEPTESETKKILIGKNFRAEIARDMARLIWEHEKSVADPDAFLVPFVQNIEKYNAYRQSPLWKKIRQSVLSSANGLCAGCGKPAAVVHHRDYRPRVLSGEDLTPLVALCSSCHNEVHYKPDGKQRVSWQDAEEALKHLVEGKKLSVVE